MAYQKNRFELWMAKQKNSKGVNYSDETISGYVASLRSHSSKLTDIKLDNTDLFTIDQLADFDVVCERIQSSKDYIKINDLYHRIFSSALNMYRRYLIDTQGSIDNQEEFEAWLRANPNHQYLERTIARYSRAINKAGEWFDVDLAARIFEINDYESFAQVQQLIKESKDYDQINMNNGHGDYSAAMNLYGKFLQEKNTSKVVNPVAGSVEGLEYSPQITKEQWLVLFPKLLGPVWGGVMAMFYTEKEGATCSTIAKKFNMNPFGVSGRCTQLAMRVHKETQCPLFVEDGKKKYWPILFTGKKADKTETGTYVWKLRDELYDALTEYNILRFLPSNNQKPMTLSVKEAIQSIKEYITSEGFTYNDGLIENFYLSLKSKPFVILAGTSGTGKTRLVRLFAHAIGAEYKMVSVRPDWSDSTDLFGHLDLNGTFVPGTIIGFIRDARDNPSKPYILCLDEMNLARVEYYLSDILSVIETRDLVSENTIVSEPLVTSEMYGSDEDALADYGELDFPENLYLVGTVNMDETTFPFSRKVLDRANTIEFNYVCLNPDDSDLVSDCQKLTVSNDFLQTKYLLLKQCKDHEFVKEICAELEAINRILQSSNAHVGYRVRDEITFYMLNNKETELLERNEAFDNEIMQKILPRIQGSSNSVKKMLCDLFKVFAGDYSGIQTETGDTASLMLNSLKKNKARYPKSAEKVAFMVRRFEEDGFTSYWL